MSSISMKDLLEAGVHFGHQTKRWDPRMKPYIYTERNGIHIIDLQKTVEKGEIAYNAVRDIVANGGKFLFVGTKKQAQEAIKSYAEGCNQYYVTHRWLGGMLTNFKTIRKSINRLKKLEKMEVDGTFEALPKKEVLQLNKERVKLERTLGGIKEMQELPRAIFIIDPKKEEIALKEAKKLSIPIFAVVDTNCNPEDIDFPIPGNDDAIRAIGLFVQIIADAIREGESMAGKELVDAYRSGKFTEDEELLEKEELEKRFEAERKAEEIAGLEGKIAVPYEEVVDPALTPDKAEDVVDTTNLKDVDVEIKTKSTPEESKPALDQTVSNPSSSDAKVPESGEQAKPEPISPTPTSEAQNID